MWNSRTEGIDYEQLPDAVLLLTGETHQIRYANVTAKQLLGACTNQPLLALFPANVAESVLTMLTQIAATPDASTSCTLPAIPPFASPVTLQGVPTVFEQETAILLTISEENASASPQLEQSLLHLLEQTYCLIVTVRKDWTTGTVLYSQNPLFAVLHTVRGLTDFLRMYADSSLHPEDVSRFLAAFAPDVLANAPCQPTVTVRRLDRGLYRWAQFSFAALDAQTVVLLGKDVNERHLQQERSAHYQQALQTLSQRNEYILAGVSDIFRLMLHIDLVTGETIVCTMADTFHKTFSYTVTYSFTEIRDALMEMVHPDDQPLFAPFLQLESFQTPVDPTQVLESIEYRRIPHAAQKNDLSAAKWTRAVIQFTGWDAQTPREAIFAVQDIHEQKLRELQAQKAENDLRQKFNILINHRFLWFIDSDYSSETSNCYQIQNNKVSYAFTCPFDRLFEMIFIPYCHPEDVKKVAKAFLPDAVKESVAKGCTQISVEYRHRTPQGWQWVRAEMYPIDGNTDTMRSMTYVSNIHAEKENLDAIAKAEHDELILRKKFGLSVQDSYLSIDEVDLNGDRFYHYELQNDNFVLVESPIPFSRLCEQYPQKHVHPDHYAKFIELFSYPQILRASREQVSILKHPFLFDLKQDKTYIWCNIVVRFFCDENGKPFLMVYLEDIDAEIRKRENELHQLEQTKQALQNTIRLSEQARIRKAHIFSNIACDVRLSLNQICGTVEKLQQSLPQETSVTEELTAITTACDSLFAMVENARDMLLLENDQLPLIQEPLLLPELFQTLKEQSTPMFASKQLQVCAYTTRVQHETIYCDRKRLSQILESIFLNIICCLPNGSDVTLRLTESPTQQNNLSNFEFSLITYGDQFSQDLQSGLCAPLRASAPINPHEHSLFTDNTQPNLTMYMNKKLIARMGGSLEYVRLSNHASAVLLTLPFPTAAGESCVFPHLPYYRKRALIWDTRQQAALALMEMLQETGLLIDWLSDPDTMYSRIANDVHAGTPYDLLFLRQSALQQAAPDLLERLQTIAPAMQLLVLADAPVPAMAIPDPTKLHIIPTPVFRSMMAKALWALTAKAQPTPPNEAKRLPDCRGKHILLIAAKESDLQQAAAVFTKANAAIYSAWNGEQAVHILSGAESGFYHLILMDLSADNDDAALETIHAIRAMARADTANLPIYGVRDASDTRPVPPEYTGILTRPFHPEDVYHVAQSIATSPE